MVLQTETMKHTKIGICFLLCCIIWIGINKLDRNAHADNTNTIKLKNMAVLPFENNSVTDPQKYEPLTRGLSAMISTDLSDNITSLKLIERSKIKAILEEISLGQSGVTDETSAAKAGKLLGAQAITIGSFMVIGKKIRIDIRVIRVETGEILTSDSVTGKSKAFMQLEQELVKKIAHSLNATFDPDHQSKTSDITAAIYYSKGIEAFDDGDSKKAKKYFNKCMKRDKSYQTKVNRILEN